MICMRITYFIGVYIRDITYSVICGVFMAAVVSSLVTTSGTYCCLAIIPPARVSAKLSGLWAVHGIDYELGRYTHSMQSYLIQGK